MESLATRSPANKLRPMLWGAAFFVSMFGAGIFARTVDLDDFWSMAIMLPPMLLLLPLIRSGEKYGAAIGCTSPALARYNRRALLWSFTYVIALFIAVMAKDRLDPHGALLWMVAVLPSLPIFYFVYTLHAYLREEQDEYLKMRFIAQALWGLGILLVLSTFYGFLESFGAVPHAAGWLSLPVWAIGMGAAGIWQRLQKA
jgi:hypothetical protein